MAEVCGLGQLWVPGMLLDNDYPIPSNEELTSAWSEYLGEQAIAAEGVFGVFRAAGNIAALASIDLCEVVRESSHMVDHVYGLEPHRRAHYKNGTWAEHIEEDIERATTMPIVQAAMNADLMVPDSDIEAIVDIMRGWRANRVYVAANTSTLPGCELATVNLFLDRHMKGCFDALVLPRNHDGKGSMTKALALSILASEIGLDENAVPLLKIDDATHHINSFLSAYGEHARSAFFIPAHAGNVDAPEELKTETSLEAFVRADEFLRKEGVVK